MSNLSTNLWYQYFMGDPSRDWILIGLFGCRVLWATLGIMFNYGVVYITVKNKNLHSVCNILIALESFFAIFQDASYFVSFGIVTSGLMFIRYETCFPILYPMAVCGDAAQITMVFTGIDRLISVLFPIWYKNRNSKWYMTFAATVIGTYMSYAAILYYLDFLKSKDFTLSCSTHEMGQSDIGYIMYVDGITLSVTLMTVYSLVWLIVFVLRRKSKNITENNRRLIKSLLFIICFNLVGVSFKSGMKLLFKSITVSVFITNGFNILFSFLTIAVYSANAPVLYIMSNEYRSKFNKHFKFIKTLTFNRFISQSQVVPTGNGFTQNVQPSTYQISSSRGLSTQPSFARSGGRSVNNWT